MIPKSCRAMKSCDYAKWYNISSMDGIYPQLNAFGPIIWEERVPLPGGKLAKMACLDHGPTLGAKGAFSSRGKEIGDQLPLDGGGA